VYGSDIGRGCYGGISKNNFFQDFNMKKLLIVYGIWSPYTHARFTVIAKHIKDMELTVFFQNPAVRYRKWDAETTDSSYKMVFLKNIGIPISVNTAFVCNINYNIYQ